MQLNSKIWLCAATLIASTYGCQKDAMIQPAGNTEGESTQNMLRFETEQDFEQKLSEIEAFEGAREEAMRADFHRGLEVDADRELTSQLLPRLKKYHAEKLESIYELRRTLKFTSLQSIADEIMSLQLLNPTKAEALLAQYADVIVKKEYGVAPVVDPIMAKVTNEHGLVKIKGEIYKFEREYTKVIKDGDESKIALLGSITSTEGMVEVISKSDSRSLSNPKFKDEGLYTSSTHPLNYLATWRVGISDIYGGKRGYMQVDSWLFSGVEWVNYPSYSIGGTATLTAFTPCRSSNILAQSVSATVYNKKSGLAILQAALCSNSSLSEIRIDARIQLTTAPNVWAGGLVEKTY